MKDNEKVLCWVDDRGFAMYDAGEDVLSWTFCALAASEATKADWGMVMKAKKHHCWHYMRRFDV